MSGINRNPNDPNKGLNTRTYLVSVLVTVIVILIGAIIFVHRDKKPLPEATDPKTTRAVSPQ